MKNNCAAWIKLVLSMCVLICAFAGSATAQDSEAALKQELANRTGSQEVQKFLYADYDGDGSCEAFALCGSVDSFTGGFTGDIWFVAPSYCETVQTGCSYLDVQMLGNTAPILFAAEEWYGGSGSTSYVWTVSGSRPKIIDNNFLGDFERGEGNEFFAYPSAFDAFSDGTGHTWKRYYFFLDGETMREYGGIQISMDELRQFNGAEALVQNAMGNNYDVTDIVYRSNGRIHVNMTRKGGGAAENKFLTLRYEGPVVFEEETGSGVYELASDPSAAAYPEFFEVPSASEETGAASSAGNSPLQFNFGQPQTQTSATLTPMNTLQPSRQVRTTGDVNVRTQPSLDGEKMGSLNSGVSLKYLNETRSDNRGVDWYKVEYEGKACWISSKYSRIVEGGPAGNTSAPVAQKPADGNQVRIVGGNANIRTGPGLNYESIGSMKEGRTVKYLGKTSRDSRGVDWYYIDFNGKIGWVSSKYSMVF